MSEYKAVGPRIGLRAVTAADQAAVFAGLSDPQVIAHYGISYDTYESCQVQMDWYDSLVRDGTGAWLVVERREDGRFLGCIGYNGCEAEHRRADIGYWLLPDVWGQGYATEALRAFTAHVFATTGLHRLRAEVEEPNRASWALLERCGFTHEGTARDCEIKDGAFISLRIYSRLATDRDPA